MKPSIDGGPGQPCARESAVDEIAAGEIAANGNRLELAAIVLINAVLWTMAIVAIYEMAQRLMSPSIWNYPVVAFLQIAAA